MRQSRVSTPPKGATASKRKLQLNYRKEGEKERQPQQQEQRSRTGSVPSAESRGHPSRPYYTPVAVPVNYRSSRVIIKNLPPFITEAALREHIAAAAAGSSRRGKLDASSVTDCVIKRNKAGKSRGIAFVGLESEAAAAALLERLKGTYVYTRKIELDYALPRSFVAGTAAGAGVAEDTAIKVAAESPEKNSTDPSAAGATGAVSGAWKQKVVPRKAGVRSERHHVLFDYGEDTSTKRAEAAEEGTTAAAAAALSELLQQDGDDDLAWLHKQKHQGEEAASTQGGALNQEQDALREEERQLIEEHGRILITNLPYCCSEEDLRCLCSTAAGETAGVYIMKDSETGKPQGRAFVTFVFPAAAAAALEKLNGMVYRGRILAAVAAKPKEQRQQQQRAEREKSSYKKRQQLLRQQQVEQLQPHKSWNLLYMLPSAAADAAGADLGVSKRDLLLQGQSHQQQSAAAAATLAEAHVLQQTKEWIEREGLLPAAFIRKGTAPTQVFKEDVERAQDAAAEAAVAVAAAEAVGAAGGGGIAPFASTDDKRTSLSQQTLLDGQKRPEEPPEPSAAPEEEFGEEQPTAAVRGFLFVKNLNFKTTEGAFREAFAATRGFLGARLMTRKGPQKTLGSSAELLSMGYGFIEYESTEAAAVAAKQQQGIVVDGHVLQVSLAKPRSTSSNNSSCSSGSSGSSAKKSPVKSNKLIVKNLGFEASKKDLRALFSAYGEVTAVRIPKNPDGNSRGFGFVTFAAAAAAGAAMEALSSAHLYGRRLILEYAESGIQTTLQRGPLVQPTEQNKQQDEQREASRDSDAEGRRSSTTSRKRSAAQQTFCAAAVCPAVSGTAVIYGCIQGWGLVGGREQLHGDSLFVGVFASQCIPTYLGRRGTDSLFAKFETMQPLILLAGTSVKEHEAE
ncbi:multiple RNA-binding domain-containing protein 1 [Cyclospora cayetanensis]|uniref:Multiple RNA-binding domain-containing protein 1 n=1 Tax=Cyclospora cayetanensis TaxID=88456 RepID=A0A6P6RXE4_9EIME|nr:multiple RNA-binding domain-containing protein 1 [Cyclospora cayetanensis]